jgi:hypothetical protein
MNPLKALYLQQRPEDESDLHSTPNADDQECKQSLRWDISGRTCCYLDFLVPRPSMVAPHCNLCVLLSLVILTRVSTK